MSQRPTPRKRWASPSQRLTESGPPTAAPGPLNPPVNLRPDPQVVITRPTSTDPNDSPKKRNLQATVSPAEATPRRMTRAVTATRLPHHILQQIFIYLSPKSLKACMLVCRHWYSVLDFEDGEVWRHQCRLRVPESALNDSYLLSEVPTAKQRLRAYYFAWNPSDANNYLRPNGFTVHRQPIAQSTDGIRGKIGVSSGIHAWEITWEGPLGTVAVIGLATKHAALHCPGYEALLGSDEQSWGWNLVDNQLLHNGISLGRYPRSNNPPKYQVGERVRLVLDCEAGTAYFERGAEFLGTAFEGLPPVRLYPAMCAVYGNTEVSLVYLGPPLMG